MEPEKTSLIQVSNQITAPWIRRKYFQKRTHEDHPCQPDGLPSGRAGTLQNESQENRLFIKLAERTSVNTNDHPSQKWFEKFEIEA